MACDTWWLFPSLFSANIFELSYLIITTTGKMRNIIYIHVQILNWCEVTCSQAYQEESTGPDFKSKTSYSRTSVLNLFSGYFERISSSNNQFSCLFMDKPWNVRELWKYHFCISDSQFISYVTIIWHHRFPTPTLPALYFSSGQILDGNS